MSNVYELEGSIKVIGEVQEFSSGFKKREIVVTVPDDKYPQDIKLEVMKEKCDALDQFSVNEEVSVSFNVRGNEYNGKFYTSLQAWKITSKGRVPHPPAGDDEEIPF